MNGERFLSEYFLTEVEARNHLMSRAKTTQAGSYFPPNGPFPLEKANWVKIILIVCERDPLRHDPFFEPAAWAALKRFQLRNGLPVTEGAVIEALAAKPPQGFRPG